MPTRTMWKQWLVILALGAVLGSCDKESPVSDDHDDDHGEVLDDQRLQRIRQAVEIVGWDWDEHTGEDECGHLEIEYRVFSKPDEGSYNVEFYHSPTGCEDDNQYTPCYRWPEGPIRLLDTLDRQYFVYKTDTGEFGAVVDRDYALYSDTTYDDLESAIIAAVVEYGSARDSEDNP